MITTEQFELIQRIAAVYHKTLYSDKSLDIIITMMLRAHGLGLPITEAVELFHFQRGKLTLSANAMATLMKRAGYTWVVNDLNDKTADITLYDAQGNELGASVFTWQDAEKANLTNKNTWTEYPRNMLMARALSNAAKWYAPDGFGGAPVYTADEMGSDDDTGYPEPEDTPPANVVDLPAPGDSSEELPGDTEEKAFAPVGSKGSLSKHWRSTLFAVGSEWAELIHDKTFDSMRTEWAQTVFSKELESFGQLNNAGAKELVLRMERDLVIEYGISSYGGDWITSKEEELCRSVSKDTAASVDELSRTELKKLLDGTSKSPGLRERANAA